MYGKRLALLIYFLLLCFMGMGQENMDFFTHWNRHQDKPLVVYFTGDGGFNAFSTSFCKKLAGEGYEVAAVNSKRYFWKKKSPDLLGREVSKEIEGLLAKNKDRKLYLVGYSFGADVIPFLVNRLSVSLKMNLQKLLLIEPSRSTDLEIHLSDLLRSSSVQRELDVLAEVNQLQGVGTAVLLATDEPTFPVKQVRLSDFETFYLKGKHDFNGKLDDVVRVVNNYLKQ